MPKPYTFPLLYDESLQLNISELKKWGYLKLGRIKSGVVTWSKRGHKQGSITIRVHNDKNKPYLELDYKFNDEPRNYSVSLVSMTSNLGKGLIWYFLCPVTNMHCRKLYLIDGYFLHREAFNGCMYATQTQSKKYRELDKKLGAFIRIDGLYSQLYRKHFKKTYAGMPTKKYSRIMEQIKKAESIPYYEIERMMQP